MEYCITTKENEGEGRNTSTQIEDTFIFVPSQGGCPLFEVSIQ